jgi:hypothetical protein
LARTLRIKAILQKTKIGLEERFANAYWIHLGAMPSLIADYSLPGFFIDPDAVAAYHATN